MKNTKITKQEKGALSRRQFLLATSVCFPVLSACSTLPKPSATPDRILQDWHMHTNRAGGKPDMNVRDMILTNEAYGLKLMGISEHIDRLDQREDFKEKIRLNRTEAEAVKLSTNMKIMIGTETTMINPKLCSLSAELATMLDYRLVSCNHYHLKHVENATPPTAEKYAGHYLEMLHGAMDLGFTDTIGHPFYHQKLHKKYGPELLHATLKAYEQDDFTAMLKRAAQVNMAFEINPRHADLALDWFKELVQEARLHGTKFTVGTDAHAIKSLGYPEGDAGRTCQDVLRDLTITDRDLKWKPIKFMA